MDAEKCKTCKYRHVYYMGTKDNPKFSDPACYWAYRYCADVKPIECHYQEDSTRRV